MLACWGGHPGPRASPMLACWGGHPISRSRAITRSSSLCGSFDLLRGAFLIEPKRCAWATTPPMIDYHDREWGVPQHDDRVLFEFLILEGAQAGLSWSTILNKRA